MALTINSKCINCDMCEPECPNQAITMGNEFYKIDPNLCTECVGHYDEPQCILACPIDCIVKKVELSETTDELWAKFKTLTKVS